MRYKKVVRWITVEFVKQETGQGYDVRVTPEQAVVRCHDTIVWDVQGLSASVAATVAVGNFQLLDPLARVTLSKKGLAAFKPKGMPKQDIPVKASGNRFKITHDLNNADPACYKYDIKADGRTLLDPDVEIRGPR